MVTFKGPSFLFLFLIMSLIASPVLGVDKTKFKTCQQSSFCRRNLEFSSSEGISPYSLVEGSLASSSSGLQGTLLNADTNTFFKFHLRAYEDNTFRMEISEQSPLRDRYSVQDVLQPLEARSWNPKNEFGNVRVEIIPSPFQLDFYIGDEKIISSNSRGFLNIEHYREKVETPENAEESTEEKKPSTYKRESTHNLWQENFSSHHDSKPHGPSSIGLDFTFVNSDFVYGIPEHADSLRLKTTKNEGEHTEPYRLYNLDVFEYILDSPMSLYGAVPLMISHRPQFTSAILWLNAAETFIDITRSQTSGDKGTHTHWMSESGVLDVFFFLGPSPYDIFRQYAKATGFHFLPPIFSLGYHQCRWNYNDQADVAFVDSKLDEFNLPYDVIWLDIEHTDNKKYMTWDQIHFPNPEEMQNEIAKKGRKMVAIIDPHIKRDGDWAFHKEAESNDLYVKKHDGSVYEGWCWSGSSSWLDFLNPTVRSWWASKLSLSEYKGSTENLFVWNDMNEPSVFNGPEVTMHKDALHLNGKVEHREVHNIYGYTMTLATYEGLVARSPQRNTRPFILTRSFFSGSQRVAAVWTGDNMADWSHLAAMSPMVLSLNLAGIHFSGADVGGFFNNPEEELVARWYQASAFVPFYRGHAHIDTKRREPYLYEDPYLSVIREALELRYSLLPFWYTLFFESSTTGAPVLRPLWVEFPEDVTTFGIDDQYLVGSQLLVKPITSKGTTSTSVLLPGKEAWFDFYDYKPYYGYSGQVTVSAPLNKIPLFIRSGSIIPRKMRARRSSTQMKNDPFTLIVALDSKQRAEGELYVDDGTTFNYQRGEYIHIKYTYEDGRLSAKVQNPKQIEVQNVIERIVVVGATSPIQTAQVEVVGSHVSKPSVSELSRHSISFTTSSYNYVIRNPAIPLQSDWVLTLS